MIRLKITGMTCQHCAQTVKEALESVEGVKRAVVYFPQGYAEVEQEEEINVETLIEAVKKAGYGAELMGTSPEVYVPEKDVYDLFVLGGGSAGFASAIRASDLGAKVLVVENRVIGGTCLNRGCIPSKYLIEVAEVYSIPKRNPFRGITLRQDRLSVEEISEFKESMVKELRKEKYLDVLKAYPNIHYLEGRGTFLREGKAEVEGREITFHKAVVTTGSRPKIPPIKGLESINYLTSDEILSIDYLPKHLLILGGGAIGLELGQVFLRLGSEVTLIEALPDILMNEEPELRERLRKVLGDEGMKILTGTKVIEVRRNREHLELLIEKDGRTSILRGTDLLVATGRTPNTEDIGLENVGVETDPSGFIKTNEYMQTTNPNIYAAGDCVGRMMLVTVAAMEGTISAENALLGNRIRMDYRSVPRAVFTDPELASVGLKEEEARESFEVEVRTLEFSKVPRAVISGRTEGVIKMVVEKESSRVLGVHVLGRHGAEIIHRAVPIVKFGLTLRDVIDMVDVYPTFSEAVKLCAQSFYKDVSKLSCCAQ